MNSVSQQNEKRKNNRDLPSSRDTELTVPMYVKHRSHNLHPNREQQLGNEPCQTLRPK